MIELLTKKLLNTNLEDPDLLLGTERYKSNKILPEANVIKIGGQSFMDRGRKGGIPTNRRDKRKFTQTSNDYWYRCRNSS